MANSSDDDTRFQMVDDRRPLQEVIESKLRHLIETGSLKPGDRLPPESDLASQMGVARGSLRAALQRLEVQRIVEVKRGRGWFVSHTAASAGSLLHGWLTEMRPDVSDVLELRLALETTATVLAAERATDDALHDLAMLSQAHRSAAEEYNVDELVQTDEAFHDKLVQASGNALLSSLYEVLVPELASWRVKAFTDDDGAAERSANNHDTILWFLQKGDAPGARVAMTNHLLELCTLATDRSPDLKMFVYDSPRLAPGVSR